MEADANFSSVKDLKKRFEGQKSSDVPEPNFKSPQRSVSKSPTEIEENSNEETKKNADFDSMDGGILALNKELDLAFSKMTAISRKLKRLSINNVEDAVLYADQLTAKLDTTVKKCHHFKKKFLLKKFVKELEKARQAGNRVRSSSSDSGSEDKDDGSAKNRKTEEVIGDRAGEIVDKSDEVKDDKVDDVKVVETVEDCKDTAVKVDASKNDKIVIVLNNEEVLCEAEVSDDNAETKEVLNVAVVNAQMKNVVVGNKQTKNVAVANLQTKDVSAGNTKTKNVAATNTQTKNVAAVNTQTKNVAAGNTQAKDVAAANTQKNNAAVDTQTKDVAAGNTQTKDVPMESKSKRGGHDEAVEVPDDNPAQVKKARFKTQTTSSCDSVSIGSASSSSSTDPLTTHKKLTRSQLKKILNFKLYKYFHRLRLIDGQEAIECMPCQEVIDSTVVDDIISSDHLLSLKHVENVLKFNANILRISLVQRPDFLEKLNIPEEFLWSERLFINANPKLIFCGACRKELSFNAKGIRRHVRESSHIEAKGTSAIERKYDLLEPRMLDFLKINRVINLPHRKDKLNCIACDVEMKCMHSEVVGHCQSSEHQSKLNQYNDVVLSDILKSNPDLFGVGHKYPITPQQLKDNKIFINPVSEFAYCGVCKTELNLVNLQFDVMKHVNSNKHTNKVLVSHEISSNKRNKIVDSSILRGEVVQVKCEVHRSEENKENEHLNANNKVLEVKNVELKENKVKVVSENDNVEVGESDKKEIIERVPLSETSIDGASATPAPPPSTPSQSWHLPDVDWIRFESEIKQLSKKNLSDFENLVREKMNLPTTLDGLVPPKQEVALPRIVSLSLEAIYDKESQNPSFESTNLFYVTNGKFFCPICNICAIPTKAAVFDHFKDPKHYKNAKSLSDPATPYAQDWKFLIQHTISHESQTNSYKCYVCSKKLFRDFLSANQHANAPTHLHKLMLSKLDSVAKKNLSGNTQTTNTNNSNPYMPDNKTRREAVGLSPTNESVIKKVGEYFMCVQCEVDICSIPMAYAHLRSVGHSPVIVNSVQYLREANYHCLACDMKVYGIKDVVYHMATMGHKTKANS